MDSTIMRSRKRLKEPRNKSRWPGAHDASQNQHPHRNGSVAAEPPRKQVQREILVALRDRLRGNVRGMASTVLSGPEHETSSVPLDTAELAHDNVDQDLTVCLLGNTKQVLDQIDVAIERIEEGTYGECDQCGRSIPNDRLEALPYTTFCVECAARREGDGRR